MRSTKNSRNDTKTTQGILNKIKEGQGSEVATASDPPAKKSATNPNLAKKRK